MCNIRKILFLIGVVWVSINTSFGSSLEESPSSHLKYRGLKRSPADAVQRLNASSLITSGDLAESLPTKIDLAAHFLKNYPVRDQGEIGSCASHAGALTFMGRSAVIGAPVYDPSILSLYYFARSKNGSTEEDEGSSLYDVWESLREIGLPESKYWPYVPQNFREKPPAEAYKNADCHKILGELGLCWVDLELASIKAALANDFFVGFGMALRESFDQAKVTGRIPIPKKGENIIGNHAMTFTGYDDGCLNLDGTSGALYVENSYGPLWGDKVGRGGRLYLPYSFFKGKNCPIFEAWAINSILGAPESAEPLKYGVSFQKTENLIPQEE